MPMDGLSLYAAARELDALTGGKIDKVQQPEKDLLVLVVRAGGQTKRLLLSTHPENGRVQLTRQTFENPDAAPAFCMLLRRRLCGGRIVSIEQNGLERALYIRVAARDELRDDVTLTLAVELVGKQANLLLLDEQSRIVDCARRVSADPGVSRVLLPGFPYEPAAPQDKLNPLEAEKADLATVFSGASASVPAFCARFSGVSKATAAALLSTYPSADALLPKLHALREGSFSPTLTLGGDGAPTGVLPFRPAETACTPYASMSEALDAFYAARDLFVRIRRHSAALRRVLEQAAKRARNRQSAFLDAMLSEDALKRDRLCGEWILANLSRIHPGDTQIAVENYYETPPKKELIPLDPKRSANENAQQYFKRYKKGKAARAYAAGQLESVGAEIAYLEGQLQNIDNCETVAELAEIRDELIRERYIRPDRSEKRKPQKAAASKPMSFTSSDGLTILIGKNNRQNDELTLKTAPPESLFLHVKNIPGSHVILFCDGEPPKQSLLEAAMLAAYYSAARGSAGVPVDYTPRRYVKKPSGAKPGLVIYQTNRTLYVTPDPLLPARLRS